VETLAQQRKQLIDSHYYETLYQKWDLYIPFMERGLKLLRKKGVFSMIVPYPLTNQLYGKTFREFVLKKYNVTEITDLNGTKIFDNATVSNIIFFANSSESGESVKISNIANDQKIFISHVKKYQELIQDEKTQVWNLAKENRKVNQHVDMHVLGDYCYISKGMVLNADEIKAKGLFTKEDLISETKDKIHSREYIESRDFRPYVVTKVRYLEYDTERVPYKLSRPTFKELYEHDKLVINRLGKLQVIFDDNHYLQSDSSFCAVLWQDLHGVENKSIDSSIKKFSRLNRSQMEKISMGVDLKYLLGIMNSKYASVLLTNQRGGDYHIYPEHIRNIPIASATPTQQRLIIFLVDKILATKKSDPSADTSALESQIDALVYKLYDLTSEEIATVEEK
jgi:adenine-specific DNA-methyltransferase